jgi:uncharacterized Zn finger protein
MLNIEANPSPNYLGVILYCEKCSNELRIVDCVIDHFNHRQMESWTYSCPNCGHQVTSTDECLVA